MTLLTPRGALFISSPPSIRILVLSRAYVCFKFYSARPVAPVLLSVLAARELYFVLRERHSDTHRHKPDLTAHQTHAMTHITLNP